MGYFAPFENVQYKFGGADNALTIFQNVSAYADILDTFKESFQHYLTYTVLDGDRPDVISAKLYDDPKYYWTFYLMNDHFFQKIFLNLVSNTFHQEIDCNLSYF